MRVFIWILVLLLSGVLPGCAASEKPNARTLIDTSAMISGARTIPGGRTFRYYAQNDPTWASMRYRFPHQTDVEPRFSGTGCIPSATANCLANLLDTQTLMTLTQHTWKGNGFSICPCSMNRYDCLGGHTRMQLTTPEDFETYLCLVIGSYFSGNNAQQEYACGTMYLMRSLLRFFGLRYEYNVSLKTAIETVQHTPGAMAVFMVGGENNAFTTGGHALTLCAVSEDRLYLLDSFARDEDEYMYNYRQMIQVIEPGLISFDREKAAWLGAYEIHLIYPD